MAAEEPGSIPLEDQMCQFGSPLTFVEENRFAELSTPDDSRTFYRLFLRPSFGDSRIDGSAALTNLAIWTFAGAAYASLLGRHLSLARIKKLARAAGIISLASIFFVRSTVAMSIGTVPQADSVWGWPVAWFAGGHPATSGSLLDPRAYHIVGALICATLWLLALALIASRRAEGPEPT